MSGQTGGSAQQPIPFAGSKIADENGLVTDWWYRLLHSMWVKLGGTASSTQQQIYVVSQGGALMAYNALTGALIGPVAQPNIVGLPVVVQTVGASPWVYTGTQGGTLVVASGKVELSRDGVNWYGCGLAGGAIPVLNGDSVRVTYYDSAPAVVLFPESL